MRVINRFFQRLHLFSSSKSLPIKQWTDSFNNKHLKVESEIKNQQPLIQYLQKYIPNSSYDPQSPSNYPSAIWVHLDKSNFHLLSPLCSSSGLNLSIHHALMDKIILYRWLDSTMGDMVTPYSMFYIACGALIVNSHDELLLVQQKIGGRAGKYGIPGGRADFGESIPHCAQRQLYEQTGISAKYQYLVYLRETNHTSENSLDLYFVCYMKHNEESLKQMKFCASEIQDHRWVHLKQVKDFLSENGVKTQRHLGKYLTEIYEKGIEFRNFEPNKTTTWSYTSPRDKIKRQFVEHMLL